MCHCVKYSDLSQGVLCHHANLILHATKWPLTETHTSKYLICGPMVVVEKLQTGNQSNWLEESGNKHCIYGCSISVEISNLKHFLIWVGSEYDSDPIT